MPGATEAQGAAITARWLVPLVVCLTACARDAPTRSIPEAPDSTFRFETSEIGIEESGGLWIRVHREASTDTTGLSFRWEWDTASRGELEVFRTFLVFGPADTVASLRITAQADATPEPLETARLYIEHAGRSSSPPLVHVFDSRPEPATGTLQFPLAVGTRWEFSVDSSWRSDNISSSRVDATERWEITRDVCWKGASYAELSVDGRPWLLLRQEGARVGGVEVGDTSLVGMLASARRRSLPWLLADFTATPGAGWTAVVADTVWLPAHWCCRESLDVRVEAEAPLALGSPAGAFIDGAELTWYIADSVGIVCELNHRDYAYGGGVYGSPTRKRFLTRFAAPSHPGAPIPQRP